MLEVQILIPTFDNGGAVFAPTHHAAFEAELINLFGGFSLLPGVVAGGWQHAGTVYRDETRVYAVSVSGIIAAGDALRAMAAFAKTHYAQLNVYVRYLGVSEIL